MPQQEARSREQRIDFSRYNQAMQDLLGRGKMPQSIQTLPIDDRGYPVPWFVANVDGVPDFRVVRPYGIVSAVRRHICWICGQKLHEMLAFTIGPMCVVNRVTSEPPSHLPCARFACEACPFLTNPRMRRNEKDLPPDAQDAAGIPIKRNPGATAIYVTVRFKLDEGLFRLGAPRRVEWWAQGRKAKRAEVVESISSGLPLLREACDKEIGFKAKEEAHIALSAMLNAAAKHLPAT